MTSMEKTSLLLFLKPGLNDSGCFRRIFLSDLHGLILVTEGRGLLLLGHLSNLCHLRRLGRKDPRGTRLEDRGLLLFRVETPLLQKRPDNKEDEEKGQDQADGGFVIHLKVFFPDRDLFFLCLLFYRRPVKRHIDDFDT